MKNTNATSLIQEMEKLNNLMGVVQSENGKNQNNNKKLLLQLNKVIKIKNNNVNIENVDASTGQQISVNYLKQQKKILIQHMKRAI